MGWWVMFFLVSSIGECTFLLKISLRFATVYVNTKCDTNGVTRDLGTQILNFEKNSRLYEL